MLMQSDKRPSNESVRNRLEKRAVRNTTGLLNSLAHRSFAQLMFVCCVSFNLFASTQCQFFNTSK